MGAAAAARETEETDPLVGVVVGPAPAAPDAKERPRAAASSASMETAVEARIRAMRAAAAEERKKMLLPRPRPPPPGPFSRLARLWRRFFVRFDPDSIPVAQPLDDEQIEMLERAMSTSLLLARCPGIPIFTMAFAGLMETSWLGRSALVASPSCLLRGLSSSLSLPIEMVPMDLSLAPP